MATIDDERLVRALQILADGARRASEALQPVTDNDAAKRLQEYLSQADETAEWYRRFEQKANMSLFEIVYGKQPQPAQRPDGCPKCGGAPSRYYFGCDTLGCENYNDGSRTNPALKAKIDASINEVTE